MAMAETYARALVERVTETGAECVDGDLAGQDGLNSCVAGVCLRGLLWRKVMLWVVRPGAIIRTRVKDGDIEGWEPGRLG